MPFRQRYRFLPARFAVFFFAAGLFTALFFVAAARLTGARFFADAFAAGGTMTL